LNVRVKAAYMVEMRKHDLLSIEYLIKYPYGSCRVSNEDKNVFLVCKISI